MLHFDNVNITDKLEALGELLCQTLKIDHSPCVIADQLIQTKT